jgi:hypothetical protein
LRAPGNKSPQGQFSAAEVVTMKRGDRYETQE